MDFSTSVIQLHTIAADEDLSRAHIRHLEQIFDTLPEVYFYVKGRTGRWVGSNIAAAHLAKFSKREDVVGAREEDFFPKTIAERIYNDDMQLMETARPLLNRIELVIDPTRHALVWATTSKMPLLNCDEVVIGLVGITRLLPENKVLPGPFEIFRVVVDHVQNNLGNKIVIEDLARLTKLSHSQFRKRFRTQFGISAQEFVLRARLQAASHLLMSSTKSIGQITYECGFSDQSYFTRQFKRFFGQSPLRHRQRWNVPTA